MSTQAWFAVKVNSRYEFRASQELRERGIEPFLPVRKSLRRWTDRRKVIEEPLFPGYVFGRFRPSERVQVLRCAGVVQILGVGRTPTPVSDEEIASVYRLMNSPVALFPYPRVPVGEKVRVEEGPLAGVEGTVVRAEDGKPRLVVSVTLLQRSVAAEVDRVWVQRVH